MALTLLLDVGNSAAKWRLIDGDQRRSGRASHRQGWEDMCALLPQVKPARTVVASVAGVEADLALAACLTVSLDCTPEFIYSTPTLFGVTNCYPQPERLGVDRWLGIVEAYVREGAAIVVDCGSAITVDAVSADGRHLGGYIVPGISMMHRSLKRETGDVRLSAKNQLGLLPGDNTDAAVGHGILRMVVAFINDSVKVFADRLAGQYQLLLTGGNAELLTPYLAASAVLCPELVLDGIERVAVDSGGE